MEPTEPEYFNDLDIGPLTKLILEQTVLEKIQIASRMCVNGEMFSISNMSIEILCDTVSRHLTFTLRSLIAGLPEKKISVHEQWPKTWWDAFKIRWFPKWLLSIYPAEMKKIDIDEQIYKAVCPHGDIPPGDKIHFQWLASQENNNE